MVEYKRINTYKIFFLVLWIIGSIFAAVNHEIWRDEMRALSIVIDNTNIWNLVSDLKNEGHPILWYLILKAAYFIYPHSVVLKIVSWIVGLFSVLILMRYSKLPRWLVILYSFSIILFWENTIMCRNYGISSLLIFIFLYLYRSGRLYWIILVLALLIQTNVLSVVIAWLLFLISIFYKQEYLRWTPQKIIAGVSLLLISTYLFYFTTAPDSTSIIISIKERNILDMMASGIKSIIIPDKLFKSFIGEIAIFNFLIAFFMLWSLISKRFLAVSFWFLIGITQFVYTEIYALYTRHLGVVFSFFIVLLDLGKVYSKKWQPTFSDTLQKFSLFVATPLFFMGMVVSTIIHVWRDFKLPATSNKELASFIEANPKYKNSILMADSDFIIEGLPYYLDNPIFIPRENCFRKFVHFTTKNKNEISTSELLRFASTDSIKKLGPVLFVCSCKFEPKGDTLYKYQNYSQLKVMFHCPEDLKRINKLKVFNTSFEDENYTLYELN
ncbi:MAG: hypothetical protein JNL75_08475 [Chitinophagales bacterium]|nr:hypothetical protein [Chitinophagales bacterium]